MTSPFRRSTPIVFHRRDETGTQRNPSFEILISLFLCPHSLATVRRLGETIVRATRVGRRGEVGDEFWQRNENKGMDPEVLKGITAVPAGGLRSEANGAGAPRVRKRTADQSPKNQTLGLVRCTSVDRTSGDHDALVPTTGSTATPSDLNR